MMENAPTQTIPFCQAPDPQPRRPRFKAPEGTTDTHFHILGPPAIYPYVDEREYTPPDALPPACRHLFETVGVQRAVLVQPSVYGSDNRRMETAARQIGLPTRMVVVTPFETEDKELQRLNDVGARAVRFILAHIGGLPIADLEPFSERIRNLGWHIQLFLRPQQLIELEERLAALRTDIVIDHIGLIRPDEGGVAQPAFQALLRLVRKGRCWVKFTGAYRYSSMPPPYRDAIPLAQALLNERPDRILWGSDWPHVVLKGEMPNTTELFDLLLEWVQDEGLMRKILVDNPQALFGF
jgi:predicted TIM-barrel fold metal-dependent hydrolase